MMTWTKVMQVELKETLVIMKHHTILQRVANEKLRTRNIN
jgi:hypothetical protein